MKGRITPRLSITYVTTASPLAASPSSMRRAMSSEIGPKGSKIALITSTDTSVSRPPIHTRWGMIGAPIVGIGALGCGTSFAVDAMVGGSGEEMWLVKACCCLGGKCEGVRKAQQACFVSPKLWAAGISSLASA